MPTMPPPHSIDILSLQKELQDKQHELTIAYQTSLELIETNNELQQQLEESTATIQALEYKMVDHEMKVTAILRVAIMRFIFFSASNCKPSSYDVHISMMSISMMSIQSIFFVS